MGRVHDPRTALERGIHLPEPTMRTRPFFAVALVVMLAAIVIGAAEEPALLLKPVVPPGTAVRVRIPLAEERPTKIMQFQAQVPRGRAKKSDKKTDKKDEMIDVTVGIETTPGTAYVSSKMWESWGYEVPPNKTAVLPSLVIPATQIAPKASKRDVQARLAAIKLEIIDPPGDSDKVRGCDLYLTFPDITRNADKAFEPRLYFADKFLDITFPSGAVKRLGTGDEPPAEPMRTSEPGLVPVAGPMVNRIAPVFTYSTINGLTQYKTPDGKTELVNVAVSSTTDFPTGVLMTMGTARGCGLELEQGSDTKGMGATFESMIAKATVKELRLGFVTLGGQKTPKDLVIQDLTVWVDKNNSGHFVWIGPRFLEAHFKDPLYAFTSDGWQLLGRALPDQLQDIKTRPKK
jgi:hypothetical protein